MDAFYDRGSTFISAIYLWSECLGSLNPNNSRNDNYYISKNDGGFLTLAMGVFVEMNYDLFVLEPVFRGSMELLK